MKAKTGAVCYECQKDKPVEMYQGFPMCDDCIRVWQQNE